MKQVTDEFAIEMIASGKPTIIDFAAEWCSPCKMMTPILEKISEKHNETIQVYKIDVDESNELTEKYMIKNIPTILFFKDGELVNKAVGIIQYQAIDNIIQENFK